MAVEKSSVMLTGEQLDYLDDLVRDVKRETRWRGMDRSLVLRALTQALMPVDLDLTAAFRDLKPGAKPADYEAALTAYFERIIQPSPR